MTPVLHQLGGALIGQNRKKSAAQERILVYNRKNLTLWEARQAVWRDRFAGLFYGEAVLLRGGIWGVDVEKQGRARM